mgnify:CR=1 FL=1
MPLLIDSPDRLAEISSYTSTKDTTIIASSAHFVFDLIFSIYELVVFKIRSDTDSMHASETESTLSVQIKEF